MEADAARRRLIERVLIEEGFSVTAVADAVSAIRAAKGRVYALAVVAAALPGSLDGAATVRLARRSQPGLRALFTAGAAEPRDRIPLLDEVIVTPLRRAELLGCVFKLLQRESLPDDSDLALRWRERRRVR